MIEDLDSFFDTDDFAVEVVVLDTQRIITGIFDRPYSDALDIQGFSPSFTMKSSEATEFLQKGYRIEVDETVFRVVLLEPDGTGVTRVVLESE